MMLGGLGISNPTALHMCRQNAWTFPFTSILRIKSTDGRRFGFVERSGDRYTVIVYDPPDATEVKQWTEVEKEDPTSPPATQ